MALLTATWLVATLALVAGVSWYVAGRDSEPDTDSGEAIQPFDAATEAERADAYAAMRDQAEDLLYTPELAGVYWRENEHQTSGQEYLFEGIVDIEPIRGAMERFPYSARLETDSVGNWVLRSLRVGDREFVDNSDETDEEPKALIR